MSNPGSRADHMRFCQNEGWDEVRNARGKSVQHHLTFELPLSDGRILRTRISRPADDTTYGPGLWRTILGEQLCLSEREFWACVTDKEPPDRGTTDPEPPEDALPAQLVFQLIRVARIPEEQVAKMTMEEAMAAMAGHWSKPKA